MEKHISEPRINDRIRVPEVRLVGPNGEQVGIVRVEDALRLAAEADLDLVEVAPMAKPPVAKLMDFGKYKYEAAMKAREARKNQVNTVIKEIKLRPKIDPHDYGTKKGHVERFLKGGDKVKVTIMFRGREQSRPELGFRLLQRLAEDVLELGTVESAPKQDGRNMVMVIAPTKKKAQAMAEQRRKRDGSAAGHHADEHADHEASTWAPSSTPQPTSRPRATRPRPRRSEAAEVEAVEVEAPEVEAPEVEAPSRGRRAPAPAARLRRAKARPAKAAAQDHQGRAQGPGHAEAPRLTDPPNASTTETHKEIGTMPKNKTHSGAKKRFRVTGSGKVMREQAGHVHKFHEKTPQKARALSMDSSCLEERPEEGQEASRPLTPIHPQISPDSKEYSRGTREAGGQRPEEAPGRPRAGQRLPRAALAALPQGQGAGPAQPRLRLPRPPGPQG